MGIQASANEDQNSRRQEDDSIVVTRTEGARAAGKHGRCAWHRGRRSTGLDEKGFSASRA
jgi:hypothetical protein